jgi:hypothetical protein
VSDLVYLLCAAASATCAVMLLRAYAERPVQLLLWSGLCFCGLTLNNVLLVVDKAVVPTRDLSALRSWSALLSVTVLLFGLLREAR